MKMTPVNSQEISTVGFVETSNTMRVAFRYGDTYVYLEVQQHMYEALIESPFIDLFFINMFENKYTRNRVTTT